MLDEPTADVFSDRHKFQDDVWGEVRLNNLERDVIDTPEYQRLFRTSQLGFVDLVYQTANHTRGAHSIGACHIAQRLMERLKKNTSHESERYAKIEISAAEQILIRLGALLHDITHVPFSHDIERKSHLIWYNRDANDRLKVPSCYGQYEKHDEYDTNPLLFLLLFDIRKSILARVLEAYSAPFWELLSKDGQRAEHAHLKDFVLLLESISSDEWDPKKKLLPELLFHLLVFEKPEEADEHNAHERPVATNYGTPSPKTTSWGIGPKRQRQRLHVSWYQPFRHDIIGNTLSADLIDYLKRDLCRLGMARELDLHLLNYYVLINTGAMDFAQNKTDDGLAVTAPVATLPPRYRCAIEVQDQRRGTSRVVLINDIFRLLDLRHEIHEKAVMHRVVQSANAMLARALLLLGKCLPPPASLARFGDEYHALQGEDLFLNSLLTTTHVEEGKAVPDSLKDSRRIIGKLIERRVYRPLLIIPGDRAEKEFTIKGNADDDSTGAEYRLRSLGALLDSRFYSPFLLFISTCIEEFLTGILETDADLLERARELARNESHLKKAMEHVPSRVIIWTTPYKQLYKDPGLIVALKSKVEQIDKLASLKANGCENDSALIKLVKASVGHADSKYANLWKVYVFISDGIYYTGILNKLLQRNSSKHGQAVATHTAKLRMCQAMVVASLDAICEHWSNYCGEHSATTSRGERLNGRMAGNDFEALIELWIPKYRNINPDNPTRGLSEVELEQYVHEWNPSGCRVNDKCRDIRYKYPAPSLDVWTKAKETSAPPALRQLVGLLEACGVTTEELSEAEFEQLVTQVDVEFESRYRALRDGNGKVLRRADLKCLWRSSIAASVAPMETPELGKPAARKPSKTPYAEPSRIELFEEAVADAMTAAWSVDIFVLPTEEQLAKLGSVESLKETTKASRKELVDALVGLSPNRDQALFERAGNLWSAFVSVPFAAAARKRKKVNPVQSLTRSKDTWIKMLGAEDKL